MIILTTRFSTQFPCLRVEDPNKVKGCFCKNVQIEKIKHNGEIEGGENPRFSAKQQQLVSWYKTYTILPRQWN